MVARTRPTRSLARKKPCKYAGNTLGYQGAYVKWSVNVPRSVRQIKRLRTKERRLNVPPCPSGRLAAMVLASTSPQTGQHNLVLTHQDKPGCPCLIVHAPHILSRRHCNRGSTYARASPVASHGLLLGPDPSPSPTLGPTDSVREHTPDHTNAIKMNNDCLSRA